VAASKPLTKSCMTPASVTDWMLTKVAVLPDAAVLPDVPEAAVEAAVEAAAEAAAEAAVEAEVEAEVEAAVEAELEPELEADFEPELEHAASTSASNVVTAIVSTRQPARGELLWDTVPPEICGNGRRRSRQARVWLADRGPADVQVHEVKVEKVLAEQECAPFGGVVKLFQDKQRLAS
jgi:hypothetical protein